MAPRSRQVSPTDRAAKSRDQALVRIRRATTFMGVSASIAVVGVGGVIAVQAQQQVAATSTGTSSGTPATTSGASAGVTGSSGASSSVLTPAPSAPAAATTSGQS